MAFGRRLKKVAFAQATGIPQTLVTDAGEEALYVPPQKSTTGEGFTLIKDSADKPDSYLGFWHNVSLGKQNIRGFKGTPPSRAMGWTWTVHSQRAPVPPIATVSPVVSIAPRQPILRAPIISEPAPYTNSVVPKGPAPRPPEIAALERAPDVPPPAGFDIQALFQTAFDAFTGAQRPPEIAPAAQPRVLRPAYAPANQVNEEEGPPVAMAGFNMRQLLIPALLIGGLFVARRFL